MTRAVTIVTFADSQQLELQVLASTVAHFHSSELHVLGLSGLAAPAGADSRKWPASTWQAGRAYPHIIKRLRYLESSLLDDRLSSTSAEEAPLGLRDDDLLVYVDGFDVLLQRQVAELPAAYSRALAAAGAPEGSVLVSGEVHCWPWPNPDEHKAHWISATDYMPNASFRLGDGKRLQGMQVCDALRRASPGHWPYPNSGSWMAPVRSARQLIVTLRGMLLEGHYHDQAMLGLLLLQRRSEAPPIAVDANASIFATQFAYEAARWQRPACLADYFDDQGRPPRQQGTQTAPFFLHFNGPSGRWRHGWCTELFARKFGARVGQRETPHFVDIDAGKRRPLPLWCGGSVEPTGAAAHAAKGHGGVPPPRECGTGEERLRCTNDKCHIANDEREEERRARKTARAPTASVASHGGGALVAMGHAGEAPSPAQGGAQGLPPGMSVEQASRELEREQAKLEQTQTKLQEMRQLEAQEQSPFFTSNLGLLGVAMLIVGGLLILTARGRPRLPGCCEGRRRAAGRGGQLYG